MSGSTIGKIFKISTWGESHGQSIGCIIDGCPAGIIIDEDYLNSYLSRRKPGQSEYTTQRKEADLANILSGVFNGISTGTPITIEIKNTNQHSKDYNNLANVYRPGHADYTYTKKYGIRDYRGGGRASGRETAARTAAGAIAMMILQELNIDVYAYTYSIGNIEIDRSKIKRDHLYNNFLNMPDNMAAKKASKYLDSILSNKDSAGGIIECVIKNLPAGIGEPVFNKLDAELAKAMLSIGGTKGFEIGAGFSASKMTGSQNNDAMLYCNDSIYKKSNNSGGITGGISEGFDILLRTSFKPTPSISLTQQTVSNDNNNVDLEIVGRHDPIIVPRAVVVVEAMTAITTVDMIFQSLSSKIDTIKNALT